jgi:hypothetical protein
MAPSKLRIGLSDLDDVEGLGDLVDRDRTPRMLELQVNCLCEALGIGT